MSHKDAATICVLAIALFWLMAAQAVCVAIQPKDDAAAALADVDRLLSRWIDIPPKGLTRVQRRRAIYDLLQTRRDANSFWDKNAVWHRPWPEQAAAYRTWSPDRPHPSFYDKPGPEHRDIIPAGD